MQTHWRFRENTTKMKMKHLHIAAVLLLFCSSLLLSLPYVCGQVATVSDSTPVLNTAVEMAAETTCPTASSEGILKNDTWYLTDSTLKSWLSCTFVNASLDLSSVTSLSISGGTSWPALTRITGDLSFRAMKASRAIDGLYKLSQVDGAINIGQMTAGYEGLPGFSFASLLILDGGLNVYNITAPTLASVFQSPRLQRLSTGLTMRRTTVTSIHGGIGSSMQDGTVAFKPNPRTGVAFNIHLTNNDRLESLLGLDTMDTVNDLTVSCSRSLPCPRLETLASLNGITSATGNVVLRDLCAIQNFYPGLSNIYSIDGTLTIDRVGTGCPTYIPPVGSSASASGWPAAAPMFLDTTAFRSLVHLGGLVFRDTSSTSLFGFEGIYTLHLNLEVFNNRFLSYMNGLSSIVVIEGNVLLDNNKVLDQINGGTSLKEIRGNLVISNNPMLTNIDGFGALVRLSNSSIITIANNTNLRSLGGLCAITAKSSVSFNQTLAQLQLPANTTMISSYLPGPMIVLSGDSSICPQQIKLMNQTLNSIQVYNSSDSGSYFLPITFQMNDSSLVYAASSDCDARPLSSFNCSCDGVSNRCLNNGTCTSVRSMDTLGNPLGFQCHCTIDVNFGLWRGDVCSFTNDTCATDPCYPGVGCVDVVNTYTPLYGLIDSKQCNYCQIGLIGGGSTCTNATAPTILACIPPYQTDDLILDTPRLWIRQTCNCPINQANFSMQLILYNFQPGASLDVEILGGEVAILNRVDSTELVFLGEKTELKNVTWLTINAPISNSSGRAPITITNLNLPSETTTRTDALTYTIANCMESGLWLDYNQNCQLCPDEGAVCPGTGEAWPMPGYWSVSGAHPPLYCAQRPESCPGALSATTPVNADGTRITNNCAEGYADFLCKSCDSNYFLDINVCRSCSFDESDRAQLVTLILTASFFFLLIASLIAVLGDWRLGCLVGWIVFIQQLISIIQTGAAALNTGTGGWSIFVSAVIRIISIVNFDVAFLKPGCSSPRLSFVGVFNATVIFFMVVLVMFQIASVIYAKYRVSPAFMAARGWSRWDAYKERAIHSLFIFGCMIYLQGTTRIFQGIICQQVNGQSVLLVDPTTVCYEGEHRTIGALCWILLFMYGIGYPVLVQFVLRDIWLPRLQNIFENPHLASRATRAAALRTRLGEDLSRGKKPFMNKETAEAAQALEREREEDSRLAHEAIVQENISASLNGIPSDIAASMNNSLDDMMSVPAANRTQVPDLPPIAESAVPPSPSSAGDPLRIRADSMSNGTVAAPGSVPSTPARKRTAVVSAHVYYDGFDKYYYLYRGTRMTTYWFRNMDSLTNFTLSLMKSLSKNIPLGLFFQAAIFLFYFLMAGILRPYRSTFENWTAMLRGVMNGGQAMLYLLLLHSSTSSTTSQSGDSGAVLELFFIDLLLGIIFVGLVLIARRPELREIRAKVLPMFAPYFLTEDEEMIVNKGGILPGWKKHWNEIPQALRKSSVAAGGPSLSVSVGGLGGLGGADSVGGTPAPGSVPATPSRMRSSMVMPASQPSLFDQLFAAGGDALDMADDEDMIPQTLALDIPIVNQLWQAGQEQLLQLQMHLAGDVAPPSPRHEEVEIELSEVSRSRNPFNPHSSDDGDLDNIYESSARGSSFSQNEFEGPASPSRKLEQEDNRNPQMSISLNADIGKARAQSEELFPSTPPSQSEASSSNHSEEHM